VSPVRIRVPASSANLGPGFDALGMAVTLALEVKIGGRGTGDGHPAVAAFGAGGGDGPLTVTSSYPAGRGLGFSGAARGAGFLAAALQRGAGFEDARGRAFEQAAEQEGHADNVAASLYGGVVATAAGRVVPVPLAREPVVVAWIPEAETATSRSRGVLPEQVAFTDAAFNVGRVAVLVAALATGDVDALRLGTADRLHQDRRLETQPDSRAALDAALDAGAWCAWLSGSGPTVVALADPARADSVAGALPPSGATRTLGIDHRGATVDPAVP
jgi:homoserine kinase